MATLQKIRSIKATVSYKAWWLNAAMSHNQLKDGLCLDHSMEARFPWRH
jgi:hypothetical protein